MGGAGAGGAGRSKLLLLLPDIYICRYYLLLLILVFIKSDIAYIAR